jgi:hypothetical protein
MMSETLLDNSEAGPAVSRPRKAIAPKNRDDGDVSETASIKRPSVGVGQKAAKREISVLDVILGND